jgi:streptomycin 6-kinase
VLKVPETRAATGDVTGAEAAALAAWASTGAAVALVDATADALLLVRSGRAR